MNGVDTRHLDLTMECVLLILQTALLLSITLSNYLLFISGVVASVFTGATGFTLGFYLLVPSAAGVIQLPVSNSALPNRPLPDSLRQPA